MPINPYEQSIINEDTLISVADKTLTRLKPTVEKTNTFDLYPLNQVEDYLHRLIVALRLVETDNPRMISVIGNLGLCVSDCVQTREISQILKQSQSLNEAVDMIANRIDAVQIFTEASEGAEYTPVVHRKYQDALQTLHSVNPDKWVIFQSELRQQQANTEYLWDLAWTAIAGMNPSLNGIVENLKDIPYLTHQLESDTTGLSQDFSRRLISTLEPKPGDIEDIHF